MECKNCGKTISDDSVYCQYCGIILDGSPKTIIRYRSLNDKTKEELIRIIMRKDKTERRNNKKIQELIKELSFLKNRGNNEERID